MIFLKKVKYHSGVIKAGEILDGESDGNAGGGDHERQQQHQPVEPLQEPSVAAARTTTTRWWGFLTGNERRKQGN